MSRRIRAWGPPLAWAALIFWASSRPATGVDLSHGLDKVAHLGAYAVLGLLLARALPAALVVAVGWVYGLSDELHQLLVPGRSAELADWIADAVGVLVGLFIYRYSTRGRSPGALARQGSS